MFPLCVDQAVGTLPWSPLARGRLARPWDQQTSRSETDEFGRSLYRGDDKPVVDAVIQVASDRGVPPAQVALAWMLAQPWVTAPIVGATKVHHLDDAVAAVDLELDPAEIEALEKPYQPRPTTGIRVGS